MNELWERLDPGFLAPIWLLGGLIAVVAIILLEIGAARRRRHAVRLFAAHHLLRDLTGSVSTAKRLLKSVLLVLGVALLFVALARPVLFYAWQEENRNGFDILFAIDCSKSMLAEDVKPSRLERAKLAISDFANQVPENRLGIIAFAGDAFLQCPLTIDHEAFQDTLNELDTDSIPRPGTDIATAIDQGMLALKSQPNNLKFLVLVTDGEDLEGHVLEAARAAAQADVKIYAVGVGTTAGDLIHQHDETGAVQDMHDSSGQIVLTKLDEKTLREIASITGGAYEPLGQNGAGLQAIYDKYIAPLPKQHLEERKEKIRFERFEWPLGAAILLLTAALLISDRARPAVDTLTAARSATPIPRRRKASAPPAPALVPAFVLLALLGGGSARASTTDEGERAYKAGKYEDAAESYQRAAQDHPERNDLQYNLGDAAYKAGEFTQAEEAFRKTLETPDLGLQEKTYYNLGNTQFKHGEAMQQADQDKTMELWQQALDSYQASLKLKNSADARHNYDVVKKKLDDLKQQKKQQDQQKKNQQQNQQQQDKSGQPSPSNQNQDKDKPGKGQDDPNKPKNNPQDSKPDQKQDQKPDPSKPQNGQGQAGPQPNPQPGQPQPGDAPQPGQKQSPVQARSVARAEDKADPGVKSRQEAEALLDSLKADEKHLTATAINGNQTPPPPPSGKDW